MSCSLLNSSHLSQCNVISSTQLQDIFACLTMHFGNEEDVVDEDCVMSGSVLFQTNVDDVVACQELLQVFGPKFGAKVFSFSNFDGLCSL